MCTTASNVHHSLHHTNVMVDTISIRFWPGLNTRAYTVSYKDLGDINRGVQEGRYFTVLTGPIFYGINQSMRL